MTATSSVLVTGEYPTSPPWSHSRGCRCEHCTTRRAAISIRVLYADYQRARAWAADYEATDRYMLALVYRTEATGARRAINALAWVKSGYPLS